MGQLQGLLLRAWIVAVASECLAAAGSSLTPNVLPLIVRNPYLSTWLGKARQPPWESWPIFWTGEEVGFSIMVSLPESKVVYPLLGRPQDSFPAESDVRVGTPSVYEATFDASSTNLTFWIDVPASSHGAIQLTLAFFSPITPTSDRRQSIPAGYLLVTAVSPVEVNLYVDVNGAWVTGDAENEIAWDLLWPATNLSSSTKTWAVRRKEEQLFTETNDRAEWGSLMFSGPLEAQHECGPSQVVRRAFATSGSAGNRLDPRFRRAMDEEPVFAFSYTVAASDEDGVNAASMPSALFTFAFVQDPVTQFASSAGLSYMKPLWAHYFDDSEELIEFHYSDFGKACRLANEFSSRLSIDARASGSESYRDIVALSARQVLGATQFSGHPDNPLLFLKEISSNGNCQTVDVIFPSFPFFLYTNPRWLGYLLEPLLEHQLSGQYPNKYSMHDLGAHFPNLTGHPDGDDEYMPVEECGNMLIMGLALANALWYEDVPASGPNRSAEHEGSATKGTEAAHWLSRAYRLWRQWTGYLIREALVPHNQLCTDDFAGWLANQTNLALKGIIGIRAMSEIARILDHGQDATFYRVIADDYITSGSVTLCPGTGHTPSWLTLAGNDHGAAARQRETADGAPETILAATRSGFVPESVYRKQSDWYMMVIQRYGLPLDSRHLYTKSDWEFFAAAVASTRTRAAIMERVAAWVNETATDCPLTDLYDTEGDGGHPDEIFFKARPVVGGHFAPLALERACQGLAVDQLAFLDVHDVLATDS